MRVLDRPTDGCRTVSPRGELDLLTAPGLDAELRASESAPCGHRVVVDLGAVLFMDCSALRVLCAARNRCLARQGWVRLVYRQRGISRLLAATGLVEVFPRYGSVPEARDGRPAPEVPPRPGARFA